MYNFAAKLQNTRDTLYIFLYLFFYFMLHFLLKVP